MDTTEHQPNAFGIMSLNRETGRYYDPAWPYEVFASGEFNRSCQTRAHADEEVGYLIRCGKLNVEVCLCGANPVYVSPT